jgi:hypothetical protein
VKRSLAEAVRGLEAIDMRADHLVDFLLVLIGEKKGTNWWAYEKTSMPGLPDHQHYPTHVHQLADWARKSGLAVEIIPEHIDTHGLRTDRRTGESIAQLYAWVPPAERQTTEQDRLMLYVARDQQWLEKLKTAERTDDDQALGEIYGFPPTAVAAFVDGTRIPPVEVTPTPELAAFAAYMVSPDHAAEDVQTAQRWAGQVRELSPRLYAGMLELGQSNLDYRLGIPNTEF